MRFGNGNGTGDGTEGAYNDTVFGTYMHGPVMARNPQIADLLLKLALDVNALPPVDDQLVRGAAGRAHRGRRPSPPDAPGGRLGGPTVGHGASAGRRDAGRPHVRTSRTA